MRSLFRYAFLGFAISAGMAMVACGNNNSNGVNGNSELENKTSLQVLTKNNPKNQETIQVVIESKEGPKSLLAYLDLDGPNSDANLLQPTNFDGAIGEITKSTLANGEVVIVAKYYLTKDVKDPQVVVFGGQTNAAGAEAGDLDVKSLRVVKDQAYLGSLNLEEETGFSKDELISQLQAWLSVQGANGVDTFAESFGDNAGN